MITLASTAAALSKPAVLNNEVPMKFTPFDTKPGIGSKPITLEQAKTFLTDADIAAGVKHGELKTIGMWQIPLSYTALATAQDFNAAEPQRDVVRVLGPRTISKPRQSGYELEGHVSIKGKKHRAFTSSCLFELPDGKLVNVAIIHVCGLVSA